MRVFNLSPGDAIWTAVSVVQGGIIMSLMRFWSYQSMWNKFGLAVVGAAVVLAVISMVLL